MLALASACLHASVSVSMARVKSAAWHEVKLGNGAQSDSATVGDALALGDSVVVCPGVATDVECSSLLEVGLAAADAQHRSFRQRTAAAMAERTSNNCASAGRTRVPTDRLTSSNTKAFNELLRRVFDVIDAQLPSVSHLFHEGSSANEYASLRSLHEADGLTFSTREPAINVYTTLGDFGAIGAEFNPHVDRQMLTVLIPLSHPESYEGGGTGFWSREARACGGWESSAVPPTVVLRPERGTALLYGGSVPHAGMPVLDGCRVCFLASFSTRRNDLESLEYS